MREEYRIFKNLAALAFGHFLVFTAFDSLSNLQSTVNNEGSVGVASQSVVYICFTVSAFFLPTYLIRRFGCKRTLLLSVFCVAPYVAANMYATWETLIPAAVISGMVFGPLWAARSTYVNDLSFRYLKLHPELSISVVNAWFFGIYSFFHENAEIWGNVLSYYTLREDISLPQVSNSSSVRCGATFCAAGTDIPPNLRPPSPQKWYSLTGIYLVFVLLAALVIALWVDPLPEVQKEDKQEPTHLFMATFTHMRNTNQLLLIPLSFYCGLADGFYNSDFTKAYVACEWGISAVGHVTICYGVVSAVVDCSSGFLIRHLGRGPVFLLATATHVSMLVTLLTVEPAEGNYYLYFGLSGIYGVGASVWWSQIIAFYGIIFKENEEPAFSNFYFWSSLGFSVAYAYNDLLCTNTKVYVLVVLLCTAALAYIAVEGKYARAQKTSLSGNNSTVANELVRC